jgi:hypothetical protein
MKKLLPFIFSLACFTTLAQNKMRPVEELLNKTESAWPIVLQWIDSASNKEEVLPCDSSKAREALFHTQVTTRSPMGAIVFHSGGILVDGGWIRILGSGNTKLTRSLPEWNKGKTFTQYGERSSYLLIADDAAGGFFAINGGSLGNDPGKVYYLSPRSLKWEPLEITYTEFLQFCFYGNLSEFYNEMRWKGWKEDLKNINGDSAYSFYPYLWSKEGADIEKTSIKPVALEELFLLAQQQRKALGL